MESSLDNLVKFLRIVKAYDATKCVFRTNIFIEKFLIVNEHDLKLLLKKEYILMNIWIISTNLKILNHQQ